MKNDTVKTLSIFFKNKRRPKWIFDVSDKTAERLLAEFDSDAKTFVIDNIPSKKGTMSIHIIKDRIDYVTVE